MDRQAAYDLLKCFLEKRSVQGIDCKKELPDLLAYGVARGCFDNPDTVFEHEEWRKYGDKLFDEVISDNKSAKKLMKPWRAVANALLQYKAEQRAAAAASERLGGSTGMRAATSQQGPLDSPSEYPLPPSVRTLTVPQGAAGTWDHPTFSPPTPEPPPAPPSGDEEAGEGMECKNPVESRGGTNPFTEGLQVARERQKTWRQIAESAMLEGDREFAASVVHEAFLATCSQLDAQGNITLTLWNLDWKLLTQLRSTVNESGLKGEPTRQMLDYIWDTNILLPGDIRSITKLILTQHQQLLFNAHWQTVWISDNKSAKKLMKPWRAVANALLQYKAEQRAAAAASERLGGSTGMRAATSQQGPLDSPSEYPLPPSVRTLTVPQGAAGTWDHPTFSPPTPEPPPAPPSGDEEAGEGMECKNPVESRGGTNPFTEGLQVARERQKTWRQIAESAMLEGDREFAASVVHEAFLATCSQLDAQGNITLTLWNLDWKLLTQLRSTVNESGLKGEPTRQMLDYIWDTNILLPGDIRSITKLILTQHQQLLFNAHWQTVCQESAATVRAPGDPLYGVTVQELMGLGPYFRAEAQALMGAEKAKEAMRLARLALDRIREPGGIPSYMGIKQGREEPFGLFIDRVANAIQAAGVPDYLKGTMLKQCAIQNCNLATRNILATLPGTWTIEEGLERMAQVPVGSQAMLVEAIKELGNSLKEHAQAMQSQVLAALAPLQTSAGRSNARGPPHLRCFRCGVTGHLRRDCNASSVWCRNCRSDTHNQAACRRAGSGNGTTQREKPPRADTKSGCLSSSTQPLPLRPAASGSLGLDLATAVDCTLLDSKPVRIATGTQGPICINGQAVGALLIGHSSATMLGLNVLVGLIDKDFYGEIQIMAQTLFPPLFIARGTKVAQLIPLPHLAGALQPLQEQPRGQGGFGSTGQMTLLTIGLCQRPRRSVTVQYGDQTISLVALLGTGADVSIIITGKWPAQWPTYPTNATVAGVGGLTLAHKSPLLRWTIENKVVNCCVSIIPLPEGVHALVGRDILAQMGMVLTSDLPF
ncbi:PREDICTED: uncharacterized protein LOC106888600 [Calidris pugnax]|uniref:uncharacterized protein LOC106888600 n=1 Tax=Calidris pugnax TaxID=198806 RepID=UPI00071DBCED|nr:PREDICTED: uncharacterized protein LOC106888600 [Calidris pugnax]